MDRDLLPTKVLSLTLSCQFKNDTFSVTVLQEKKRSSAKHTWMITYGASCPSINQQMLRSNGLEVDECYTIAWRESKYTLFHLPYTGRVRESSIFKTMQRLKDSHGINLGGILGYDAIASNTTEQNIESHVGFKRMIQVVNSQPETMEWWMQNESDLINNKRGVLWKYLHAVPPTEMSKAQLIKRLQDQEQLLNATLLDQGQANVTISPPKPSFSHTRSILFRYHHDKPTRNIMKEVSRMERKLNAREASDHKEGEIYAAWNPLMTDLHKLGFTNIDAETRVKALQTAGVLEPFHLVRHARVPDAR